MPWSLPIFSGLGLLLAAILSLTGAQMPGHHAAPHRIIHQPSHSR